jgi:hypothetical protein
MRKMLFAGDAPWSCVRDGIEYFQTTTLAGADSATKQAIKEVFGAKGSKVDVDLMTVPHHGSTNNMDVNGNYPVNATNIIVCSGDGGIKYSTTMADGTAVTELLEQFSTCHRLLHDGEVPSSHHRELGQSPTAVLDRFVIPSALK